MHVWLKLGAFVVRACVHAFSYKWRHGANLYTKMCTSILNLKYVIQESKCNEWRFILSFSIFFSQCGIDATIRKVIPLLIIFSSSVKLNSVKFFCVTMLTQHCILINQFEWNLNGLSLLYLISQILLGIWIALNIILLFN